MNIFANMPVIPEREGRTLADIEPAFSKRDPFVIRGFVKDWPLVRAGCESVTKARDFLLRHHQDRNFTFTMAEERCNGRIFYDDSMKMDIVMGEAKLPVIFDKMAQSESLDKQPVIYLGSIDIGKYFKGLHEAHPMDMGDRKCLESIWIGTRTCIAAHNDFPDNLACVTVGRRRFTLFPPGAYKDLYIGPLENTPAGRPVSLVSFHDPDFGAHPRFEHALEMAQTAILEPGDAIFIPSMWWHHVDGLEPFNVLINYWWRETPYFLGHPEDALFHAIMAIRDLPQEQKQHWQDVFQHYVFENRPETTHHIPYVDRTILSQLDAAKANKIRSYLLRALSQ